MNTNAKTKEVMKMMKKKDKKDNKSFIELLEQHFINYFIICQYRNF